MLGLSKSVLVLLVIGKVAAGPCLLEANQDRPPSQATTNRHPLDVDTTVDLAPFLDLAKYLVKPVAPRKDPKTGFRVGGTNDSTLIRGLDEINGQTISQLERDMRPGAESEVGSEGGFLGPNESLLAILEQDNRYVVEELQLTHQEIARHLHAMGTIAYWQRGRGEAETEFVYHGRRFKVKLMITRGYQLSPFRDDTKSGSNVIVENIDARTKLEYALLVPYMIDRYGFYEGEGTPYRVAPRDILLVFDFLESKSKR